MTELTRFLWMSNLTEIEKELYRVIHTALVDNFHPDSNEENILLTQITMVVGYAVKEYTEELQEAIRHLQETVKRQHV